METSDEIRKAMELYALERYQEARLIFESQLVTHPESMEVLSGLISTLAALKDYSALRRTIQRSLMRQPDNVVLLCQLALCELEMNSVDAAMTYFRIAIDKDPSFLPSYLHLSELEYQSKEYEKAIRIARKGIYVDERNVVLHMTLGKAARMSLQPELARRHWRRALHHEPQNEEALQFLAALALEEGQSAQAWALALRIDRINTQSPVAPMVKGMIRLEQGDLTAAAACFRRVVEIDPNDSKGWHQLGTALYQQGTFTEAQIAFRQCVELCPSMSRGWHNLGKTHQELKAYEEALGAYQVALDLDPGFTGSLAGVVQTKRLLCDWSNINTLQADLIERLGKVDDIDDIATIPLLLHTMISERGTDHLALAKKWVAQQTCEESTGAHRVPFGPSRKCRIAYLTHDCKEHPMAQLMVNVFELHNRSEFEVFCYSTGPDDGSLYRKRIESGVDHFVDASTWAHERLAQRIREDDIHILIDLMGHTHGARFPVLAMRPAPIQVTWLGYPGTTGAHFIDYIFVDKCVAPKENEGHFSEKCAYLTVYQPNDSTLPFPERLARESVGLPLDSIVLGCFCRAEKFDPILFDVWMSILKKHPKTVLWLYVPNVATQTHLLAFGQRYGLDETRILFADKIPKSKHLRRLTTLDLALDTRVYNGHTTTSDALLAGVPVITLAGDHFASRVSASLLHVQGLQECVTHSVAEYAQMVSHLVENKVALHELRMKTNQARSAGPLFQTHRIVREVEHRLWQMVHRYESGEQPGVLEGSFDGES